MASFDTVSGLASVQGTVLSVRDLARHSSIKVRFGLKAKAQCWAQRIWFAFTSPITQIWRRLITEAIGIRRFDLRKTLCVANANGVPVFQRCGRRVEKQNSDNCLGKMLGAQGRNPICFTPAGAADL